MTNKYHDEGSTFFTFLNYVDSCFAEPANQSPGDLRANYQQIYDQEIPKPKSERAKSLDDCYDWSTVKIGPYEEVGALNDCVWGSFDIKNDIETDNKILREDRKWSETNHVNLHPSITVNNLTFTNATGHTLAMAICEAYREAPDECELSWKIEYKNIMDFESQDLPTDQDVLF